MGLSAKIFGSSGNKQISTLSGAQQQYMDSQLAALQGGIKKNADTMQGYADEGHNSYDAVSGDALVGTMNDRIAEDRARQIAALKGSSANRFSNMYNAGAGAINRDASEQQTNLNYQNLMQKTQQDAAAYDRQIGAIQGINNQGNIMLGRQAVENQQTVNNGLLGKLGQVAGGVANIGQMAKTIGGLGVMGGGASGGGAGGAGSGGAGGMMIKK